MVIYLICIWKNGYLEKNDLLNTTIGTKQNHGSPSNFEVLCYYAIVSMLIRKNILQVASYFKYDALPFRPHPKVLWTVC